MKQTQRTERQERRNKFTEIPKNYLPIWSHSIDYYASRFCHFVQRFRIRDISDNLRNFAREHPGIDLQPASYLLNTQIMISDHYAVAYSGQNFSFSAYFCIVVLNCLNLYLRWSSRADICTIIVIFKKKKKKRENQLGIIPNALRNALTTTTTTKITTSIKQLLQLALRQITNRFQTKLPAGKMYSKMNTFEENISYFG